MPHAGMQPGPLGLETTAWNATVGLPYCDEQPMPVNEFRWGLAATAGALHFLHVDCEGLGTFIDVKCGEKIFFVPRPNLLSHPRPSRDAHDTFGNTELFLEDYSPDNPERSMWSVEAILLPAGSRMCVILINFFSFVTKFQKNSTTEYASCRFHPIERYLSRRSFLLEVNHSGYLLWNCTYFHRRESGDKCHSPLF